MKNLKALLAVAIVLMLALGSAVSAFAEAGEKSITFGTVSGAGDLDPAGIAIDMWTEYCKLCVDPLIRFDEEGNTVYEAAESYDVSEDGLVWTFHLRQNAGWSDGSPVVADDFINTIQRALNPENGMSIYASVLYPIAGAQEARSGEGSLEDVAVVALDDYTLEMTLKAPCPYFNQLLTVGPFYPSKTGVATLEDPSWWKNPETSLGNGAFYLSEYVDGDHYVVKKNPYFWNADEVKLDSVRVCFLYDQQALLAAFQTGEVDVASGLPDYIADAYAGSDELFMWNMLTSKFILPNLEVEPLNDERVREAIALGINRSEVCAVVGLDYIPSTSYVAEYMLSNSSSEYFSKEQEPLFTEDVEKAQALLVEAGYPNGEGFPTLTYTYPSSDKDALLAQAIQASLKQNLGINIELNGVEDQVYSSVRAEGSYELIRHSWTADFNDPINYLDLYTSYSGGNYNHVNIPEYDEVIEASNVETDPQARNALLHKAERILVSENFDVIPVCTQVYVCLWNPNLTNVTANEKGEHMYRYADIAQ
ncbi:MAG: peptide ABC transporter substrate-binding protein [Clostridia bacterium]|nr:peptide ABC transporter substrate-binding protein [Clostridia bacterium]